MIRPAQITDLPWLRKLHMDFCTEQPAHYPHMDAEEFDAFVVALASAIRQDQTFLLLVAEHEHRVIGYLGAGILFRVAGKPRQVCSICWCYVIPEHRGSGLSRQFAAHVSIWLREKFPHITAIEIMANAGDHQWANRGMQPFLVHHHCDLNLLDAYVRGENPHTADTQAVAVATHMVRKRKKRMNGVPVIPPTERGPDEVQDDG